jgi:hypothetical protein
MEPRTTYVRPRSPSFPLQRSASVPQQRSRPGTTEPLDGLGQVTALVHDGLTGVPSALRSPRRTALWVLWLIGIVGDASTSLAMIRSGLFAEGNPLAAVGMGSVGMTGYVVLSSALCLFLAAISTGRPSGPVARVAVGFLLLVGAGKVFMVFSNVLVWRAMTGS